MWQIGFAFHCFCYFFKQPVFLHSNNFSYLTHACTYTGIGILTKRKSRQMCSFSFSSLASCCAGVIWRFPNLVLCYCACKATLEKKGERKTFMSSKTHIILNLWVKRTSRWNVNCALVTDKCLWVWRTPIHILRTPLKAKFPKLCAKTFEEQFDAVTIAMG